MDQRELLIYSVDVAERIGIPYMIVGSIASGAYGEPRLTQNIDIVIVPSLDQVRELCAAFPNDDFYVSVEALRAAQTPGAQGGSEKHVRDISGILKVSDAMVDRNYVAQWAESLGLSEIWSAILKRVAAPGSAS